MENDESFEREAIAYLLPIDIIFQDNINLGDGTIIRKISNEEKELKKQGNSLAIRHMDINYLNYVIVAHGKYYPDLDIPWEIDFTGQSPYHEIEKKFDKVVLALRLFKSGIVGYNEFDFFGDEEWGPTIDGTISRLTYFLGSNPYKLEASEVNDFIDFYKKLSNLNEINFMKIALERFRTLYERQNVEDRLIDLFVAFESLFLEENSELTYRLSINIAFYLGNNKEEKKRIFKDIKNGYKLRSKIVHGTTVNQEDLNKSYLKLEEYLRICLIKILEGKQGRGKKDLLNYVEDSIFW